MQRRLLERVRKMCLALPLASERASHGEPCFFVNEKHQFVMCADDHHGDGRVALWLAAEPGAQDVLVAADPARFFRPPYVGTRGWIGVRIDKHPDWKHIAILIGEAYRVVAEAHVRR
jgi:hypothetical protein